ncbi:MAG: prepilin-type N-terminal cleavage/methylation domain-containing protein [Bacteroidota bacterium]
MIKREKLPGFTLLELLIVLILMGILISLAGGVFYNLNTYRLQVERRSGPINATSRLEFTLRNDVEQAKELNIEDQVLSCYRMTDTVTYVVSTDELIRTQAGLVDTFQLESSISKVMVTNQRLRQFELSLTDQLGRTYHYFFSKDYSVAEKMK